MTLAAMVVGQVVGHGVDVVSIERIAGMLERHDDRFVERCFSSREQAYCDAGGKARAERYAARFAAKEAVYKAMGAAEVEGLGWLEAEVINRPSGLPTLEVSGQVKAAAKKLGVTGWHISLTHGAGVAIASVIACRDQSAG